MVEYVDNGLPEYKPKELPRSVMPELRKVAKAAAEQAKGETKSISDLD